MMRFLFIALLCHPLWAADVFVDQNWGLITPPGATPGRSITNAFKEFWKATTNATGGDRIVVAPGSVIPCNNWSARYSGTADDSKVLLFADVFNLAGFTNASGTKLAPGGCYFSNKTNGWTATAAADDTIDFNGYSNVAFYGFYIHNTAGGRSIKANSNSRRLYVTNCVLNSDQNYPMDFNTSLSDGFWFAAESSVFINTSATLSGINGLSYAWAGIAGSDWDMRAVTRNNIYVSYKDFAAGGFKSGAAGGTAGGWLSTNDTFWGALGMVTGSSSTNTFPYIFDSCLIENTTTIQHTGQVRMFRTTLNGPVVANLTLNDSSVGVYTNNMAGFMFNFDHGMSVGLGQDGWLKPLAASPAVASGVTNGAATDVYRKSRPSVVARGAAEPVKLPFMGRAE